MNTASYLSPGYNVYRNTALSGTKQSVKALNGNVYAFTFANPNTVPIYVKFFDAASADVTVGTTTPAFVITIPAGDGVSPGQVILAAGDDIYRHFNTALTIAAVTSLADAGTTSPITAIYSEIVYR